jgi:hypothetical protein
MPINVVWQELSGFAPVNLRTAAANEVRRKRKPPGLVADLASSVRAATPKGGLATLPADAYEVQKRWTDGRPWVVILKGEVEVAGIPCRGEAAFGRNGGTLVWFHPNQRVSCLHLTSDLDIDGIPCASGKHLGLALNFHRNGRLAGAVLAREHILDSRTFPRGTHVSFDEKGRLVRVFVQEDGK